ncbi:MAG: hypothetical protein KF774_03625 [Planctomyces sp.]|nr:hypothetical protein [Planctomyces sp.]
MGFLKRQSRTSVRDGAPRTGRSSFEGVTDQQLEEHLSIARYGSYLLTDAIRPSFDLQVVPSAGWRRDSYEDEESGVSVPVIIASQTLERLFDLFIELLTPLGDEVDVVLETSHRRDGRKHRDLNRESIDLPILKSLLYDFEDLLLNDGCTGIAVLNPGIPLEVQFDEHKLLVLYGHELDEFEAILNENRLPESDTIRFLTEGEHVHSSTEEHSSRFLELGCRLGVDD